MSAQPMLETKEVDAVPAQIAVPATIVPVVDEQKTKYDASATSLRRASTALLFFSLLCARPWPSAGWLGVVAAISVLCASSKKLLCRARFARFLSGILVILTCITLGKLVVSLHADKPQHVGDKVLGECLKTPADTFEWGHQMLAEHDCVRKGLSFLSRHLVPNDTNNKEAVTTAPSDADDLAARANASSHLLAAVLDDGTVKPAWSQPEACDHLARLAARLAKMMMIASALAHTLVLLSAVAVVKRACRLRCAAYKCGLLTWKKCGGCKCASKPPVGVAPAGKELQP